MKMTSRTVWVAGCESRILNTNGHSVFSVELREGLDAKALQAAGKRADSVVNLQDPTMSRLDGRF